jgi:hypothetical protein
MASPELQRRILQLKQMEHDPNAAITFGNKDRYISFDVRRVGFKSPEKPDLLPVLVPKFVYTGKQRIISTPPKNKASPLIAEFIKTSDKTGKGFHTALAILSEAFFGHPDGNQIEAMRHALRREGRTYGFYPDIDYREEKADKKKKISAMDVEKSLAVIMKGGIGEFEKRARIENFQNRKPEYYQRRFRLFAFMEILGQMALQRGQRFNNPFKRITWEEMDAMEGIYENAA